MTRQTRQVQIPEALFLDLCRVYLAGVDDPAIDARIQTGLQAKMTAILRREAYSRMAGAETPGDYQAALAAYLNRE